MAVYVERDLQALVKRIYHIRMHFKYPAENMVERNIKIIIQNSADTYIS